MATSEHGAQQRRSAVVAGDWELSATWGSGGGDRVSADEGKEGEIREEERKKRERKKEGVKENRFRGFFFTFFSLKHDVGTS